MNRFGVVILFFFMGFFCNAQGNYNYFQAIQDNEPNGENPYGKLHPKAPEEVKEFKFMIGTFRCTDSILKPDGNFIVYPSIWKAKYFLNGYAIQDNSFNPRNPTSNLRVYDPKSKRWKVTYLQSAMGYFTGVWEGKKNSEGEIVLVSEQQGTNSKLVFYNISDKSYNWKSVSITKDGAERVGWRKLCVRQR